MAVRQTAESVADAVKLPLAQHGVRQVRVVVSVGVRCQRPDTRVLQPCPETADQALARSVEQRTDSQGHEPMMASHRQVGTAADTRDRGWAPYWAETTHRLVMRGRGSDVGDVGGEEVDSGAVAVAAVAVVVLDGAGVDLAGRCALFVVLTTAIA